MIRKMRRIGVVTVTVVAVLVAAMLPAWATLPASWTSYLDGPAHSSYNSLATSITPANAATLTHDWTWSPAAATQPGQPNGLLASPTVLDGVVYIGANNGNFYALNSGNGKVLWSQPIGYVTGETCGPQGVVSTATVEDAPDGGPLTVYVAGGDGYLYALDAATGDIDWQSVIALPSTTENNYFDWSSPLVVNGNIYIGQSSQCDDPLINGGEKEYNQATGALENFFQTYPGHQVQPSIWSSAAYDSAGVFVTTGNGPGGYEVSVVRLDPDTLAPEDSWAIPKPEQAPDSDFGGSPTLFTATLDGVVTPMVGACNKNGVYYAWMQDDLAAGPVWQDTVGTVYNHGVTECDAAAIWNGTDLFIAGNGEMINGVSYLGDIQEVDPATGDYIWQVGLSGPPIGSPTMDGAGVIAVTQYGIGSASKTYPLTLIDSATGTVLNTINIGPEFGQPVFAGPRIFVPTEYRGLQVYSG